MTVVKINASVCGRIDPSDGEPYTREEFVSHYNAIYLAGNRVCKLR